MTTRRVSRDLVRRVERLEEKSGLRTCATCGGWHDVIHLDFDGRGEEKWGPWPAPDHRCPACGREPRVFVVQFHRTLLAEMLASEGYSASPALPSPGARSIRPNARDLGDGHR